ncbi:MAG: hypothetical protein H7A51_01095 [Akkermansiaceae bacterium]|nr:hypothetical protein [Akkermansiaceae bacterium]
MKTQHTHTVICTLAASLSFVTALQAGEGADEPTPSGLFPSDFGTPGYISPTYYIPVAVENYLNEPWDLPGTSARRFSVGFNLGSSGNINFEPFNPTSSTYYQGYAGLQGHWKSGPTSIGYEVGVTGTRYSDGIYREGHDKSMYDVAASLRVRHELDQGSVIYNNTKIHWGGHGSLEENFIFPGVQQKDALNWRSSTQLAWRPDGQPEFSTGWQQRTTLYWGGFNQDKDNWNDSYRINLGHQAEYITSPGHAWFGSAEYGIRDFTEMGDYNSDSIRIGVGRFGRLPCGAHYRISGGLHRLEYENSYYDTRDEFYFHGSIYGNLANVFYRIFIDHGIHHDLVNWGGGNFVDPVGTKAGIALAYQATDKIRLGANFTGQHLQADSTRMATGELGFYTAGFGVSYQQNENTEYSLNAGVHRASYSNPGIGSSDIFTTFNIGMKVSF